MKYLENMMIWALTLDFLGSMLCQQTVMILLLGNPALQPSVKGNLVLDKAFDSPSPDKADNDTACTCQS